MWTERTYKARKSVDEKTSMRETRASVLSNRIDSRERRDVRLFICPKVHGLLLCALMATAGRAYGQLAGSGAPASNPGERDNVPRVPGLSSPLRGVNAGLTYAGVHNSQIGWYQVLVPAVSYSFSDHFSADASATVYLRRFVQNPDPFTDPPKKLVLDAVDSGDTMFGLHGSFRPHGFGDTVTAALTVPTGNRTNGLGTGRVTFDFSNHLERFFGNKGLHLDLGMGDSSGVANNLLMRDYNTLGALAHFETGTSLWVHRFGFVQSSIYEQLPIGNQKVYQFVHFGSDTSEQQVLVSNGVSEDNGLTTLFGVPLTSHVLFSGYYNRSLRQHQDTVSLGMTFVLRSLPGKRRLSMIDRALREAAGLSANPE